MSSRERNLLILLTAMAFLAANVLAYKVWYEPRMNKMVKQRKTAESEARFNEVEAASTESLMLDREWLTNNEPEPTNLGTAKAQIQQLAENEAKKAGLVIKTNKYGQDIVEPAYNYHRVRYEMEVNGLESSIFRWLDRLHNPNDFRAVTYVRLNPQRDDATKADCEVYVDLWFVPETQS